MATNLNKRDIAIIGYNTDNPYDSVTFVLLADVTSGTQIYFTTRAWGGSSFTGAATIGTNTTVYTAGADLAAGTILTAPSFSGLVDSGATVYVYQGTDADTPTNLLYAANIADGNTTFNGNLTGTGLSVAAGTAVAIAGDNAAFGDRGHNIQLSDLLTSISDPVNWTSDNSSAQTVLASGQLDNAPDQQVWVAIAGDAGLLRLSRDGVDTASQQLALYQSVDTPATYFNHPNEIVFDTAHGLFFIADTDTGNRRILQGNIADLANPGALPTLKVLYTDQSAGTAGGQINGLAIDFDHNSTQGALYFVNKTNFDRVLYNYDGNSTLNQTPTLLANFGAGQFANEIALDITNNRAVVLSTASSTEAIAADQNDPGALYDPDSDSYYIIATNVTNNQFYYITGLDRTDTGIGQNVVTPLNFSGAFDDPDISGTTDFNDAKGLITSIDIDPTTGLLYFTTQQLNNGVGGATGGIFTFNLSNNSVVELYTEGNSTDYGFKYIDVDPASGRYYVTNQSVDESNGNAITSSVLVHGLSAGAPTQFSLTPTTNSAQPWGLIIQNAPTLTGTGQNVAVTEADTAPNSGETARVNLFSGLVAADIDPQTGDELAGAQVRISANFQTGAQHQDFLRIIGNTSGVLAAQGISYSYDSTTGVMTLTGAATVAEYATALALVQFSTSGDNITNYGTAGTRTVAASVFDGLLYSDELNASITVTGINDAPINTVGAAGAATEDGSAFALTGVSISDVDADPASQSMIVTLSVAHGTITILTNVTNGIGAGAITGGTNGSATITLTATQAQINNTLAAGGGLTYTPTANYNGADALTVTTNDQGRNGNDPLLTGTGASEQDSDDKVIIVTAVNDAPTVAGDGTEVQPAILEDTPLTNLTAPTVASVFGGQFADTLDQQQTGGNPSGSVANTLAGVAVVANGSSGAIGQWQYWTGAAWADIGPASLASAQLINAGALIRFAPALDYFGTAPTLTVRLVDSSGAPFANGDDVNLSAGGATGGTTRYSIAAVTLDQSVTSVNDAPTSAGLSADVATYTEGQAQAALLDVGSNAVIADVDSANFDIGTLTVAISGGLVAGEDQLVIRVTGTVSFTPTAVFVGPTQIGTYTGGGAGGSPLVFTFDADATPAAVTELVRAIAYTNGNVDNPTGGTRTITWTFVDGDGTANTGVDTLTVASSVNVIPVNDAPSGTNHTATLLEDGSYTLAAGDFGFSDPAEGNAFAGVVLTTLPAAGTLLLNGVPITVAGTFVSAANVAANLLTYQPAPNAAGTGYSSFTFAVRDNGGTASSGQDTDQSPNTFTFDVTPVNDAPTSTDLSGDAASYTEGAAVVLLDVGSNATIADIDSLDFDIGTLTVHIVNPVAAEDQLILDAVGGVTVAGNAVSVGGVQIATFTGGGAGAGDLVFTFDADATPATVQALIRAIGYTNSDLTSPTGGTRNITWTLVDGDGTANSGADTLTVASTVEVINVNTAPEGADNTLTLLEDGTRILATGDFGFDDPTEGDAFSGVVLTTLPGGGTLLLNGIAITVAGTFVSAANIAANLLSYQPAPNASGAGYGTFTFAVRDNGGTANGGQDTDQSPNTMAINVTPVNDAPTATNLNGDGVTWIEGGALVRLDAGQNATIGDIDSANFDGGTLTLAISGGGVPGQDVLGIDTDATVTLLGNAVLVSGTQIATVTGGSGGTSLVFTFDPNATPAAVQELVRHIGYTNTGSISPAAGIRTITWTLVDGDGIADGGADTLTLTSSVDVQAINDAPAGTDAAFTINEDATYAFTAASFGFSDVNSDAFAGVVVTGIPVPGTLFYDADGAGAGAAVPVTVGTFISASEIALGHLYYTPVQNGNGVPFSSFTFAVRDNGGTANGGQDTDQSPNTVTFNVTAVNDAPTNSVPGGQTINEDASVTFSTVNGNAISVADIDATTLSVTLSVAHGTLTIASTAGLNFVGGSDGTADATMTFSGTAAAINAALGLGLTYNPNANFNGADAIAVVTNDGGETGTGSVGTDSDTIAISITAVNDAPVVIGDGTESATAINEDTPGAGQTIQALFAGQYSDAADNQVPNGGASSPGQFSGIAVTGNGSSGATGQWQYFSGGVWTNIGAVSESAAKLLGDPFVTLMRFSPAPDFNGPAPTLTVHLIDNSLSFGIVNGQVVDISAAGATGGATAYSAGTVVLSQAVTAVNDAPVNTVPGAQTINEDASFTLSTGGGNALSVADIDATTLTVTLSVAHGTLTIASTLGLSFAGGSDGTADAAMTFSGSAAAINAALGAGLTYNPTANYNGPDAIAVATTDGGQTGTGGTLSDADSVTITVNSVNDAPSGTSKTVSVSEDDPYVFTAADFGFSDLVDGNAFLAISITSFPANGTLFLDPDGPGGAAPVNLATVGVGVFVGIAAINAGHLYFQPDLDEFGTGYASFGFKVQDNGGVLNGGVDLDPTANTITIDVTPDNIPPVAGADTKAAMEDEAAPYTVAELLVNDTDADLDALTIIAVSNPLNGTVELKDNGTPGNPNDDIIVFTPTANFNGVAGFDYTVSDGKALGTATGHVKVDVEPVNDAPTVASPQAVGTAEDTPVVVTVAAADIDGDVLSYAVTKGPAHGSVGGGGTGNNLITYTPTANFTGTDSFTVKVSDGNGGTASQVVNVFISAIDDPPIIISGFGADSAAVSVPEGTIEVLTVNAFDVDAPAGGLVFSIAGGADAARFTIDPSGGALSFKAAPDFEVPGDVGANNVYDVVVKVTAGDQFDSQAIAVTVTDINDRPVAPAKNSVTTNEDTPSAAVTIGASDPEGDPLAFSVKPGSAPAKGSVAFADGKFIYTPSADANGSDAFTIVIADGKGAPVEQQVSVTITPVNDAPVAKDDALATPTDTAASALLASLLANDSDIDGDTLAITGVSGATGGTVMIKGTSVEFTPTAGFTGTAGFDYTVSDGKLTDTGHVTVTVGTVNRAPTVAPAQAVKTLEDVAVALTVKASDPDGDALTYAAGVAAHGTVAAGKDGAFVYTPSADYKGSDSFTVTVSDGKGGTAVQTVSVTVAELPAADDWRLFAATGFAGEVGGSGAVFGTDGFQALSLLDLPGAITFDPSFNRGGDVITLAGSASAWQVVRSGSSALLSDGDSFVAIPAGPAGTAIAFADGVRVLMFDTAAGAIRIGAQTVGDVLTIITATVDGGLPTEGATPGALARFYLGEDVSAIAGGNLSVFGANGNETLTLTQGNATLDPSFNRGGDRLILGEAAATFSAVRFGSGVKLDGTDTDVFIPVGDKGMTIHFADGDKTIIYDPTLDLVSIGTQTITFTATLISDFA